MNVSSVKNLNGEVFSAVQDASLTNVVQTNSSNWDNVSNKLDTTSFSDVSSTFLTAVDLTPYQTTAGMTAYQPVGDYATTADLALKQDTLTFDYDEQNRISAINNSAIAAGDEFPVSADEAIQYVQTNSANIDDTVTSYQTNSSTYMVEPNLEYNAVNEISGYNGSAIAQYGAEKQWLQHDDTIVHVSNSAQYAFGCNISALQRLMGIDETVLFFAGNESSGVQSGNLTESIKNFKRIRVAGMDNDGHTDVKYIYPAWTKNADGFSTSGYEVMLYGANPYATQSTVWEKWTRYSFSALTSFNVVLSYEGSYTANSVNNVTNNHKNSIREVIGIGRISG